MNYPAFKQMRAGRHPIIGMMLFLLLLLQTLAGSGSLHLHLHADAAAVDHQCLVTHFAGGHVDLAPPTVAVIPPCESAPTLFPVAEVFASEPSDYLLPSRGPPSQA